MRVRPFATHSLVQILLLLLTFLAFLVRISFQQQTESSLPQSNSFESRFSTVFGTRYPRFWDEVHGLTGVKELHEKGLRGKGITIAIIDSFFPFSGSSDDGSPILSAEGPGMICMSGNKNVVEYRSYIGSVLQEWIKAAQTSKRLCHGAATHSICCCNSNIIKGVAPESSVLLYTVSYPAAPPTIPDSIPQDVYERNMEEAIERAYIMGASVISISIGVSSVHSSPTLSKIFDRALQRGIIVLVASSNNGRQGLFTLSSGASSLGSVAVGHLETGFRPAFEFFLSWPASNGGAREAMVIPVFLHSASYTEINLVPVITVFSKTAVGMQFLDLCSGPLNPASLSVGVHSILVVRFSVSVLSRSMCQRNLVRLINRFQPKVVLLGESSQMSDEDIGNLQSLAGSSTIVGVISDEEVLTRPLERLSELHVDLKGSFASVRDAIPIAFPSTTKIDQKTVAPSSGTGPTIEFNIPPLILAPGSHLIVSTGWYDHSGIAIVSGTSFST